jgi:pimeloyl-ACP methyl ester carboxylesterase
MATYVLIHDTWHTGKALEPTASLLGEAGHRVDTPTVAGNRPGDPKTVGLDDAIRSIADYLAEQNLTDVILLGHGYGGMIITGVADRLAERIRRLVYWNAFVPNNGESLNDMAVYVRLCTAQRGDGSITLPFKIWRETFINDVDRETAQKAYDTLVPHPEKTLWIKSRSRPIQRTWSWINRSSTTPTMPGCRIGIRGIRSCRENWVCSVWCKRPAAMNCVFRMVQLTVNLRLGADQRSWLFRCLF